MPTPVLRSSSRTGQTTYCDRPSAFGGILVSAFRRSRVLDIEVNLMGWAFSAVEEEVPSTGDGDATDRCRSGTPHLDSGLGLDGQARPNCG